jgi:deoxycytidylate deaminase
MKKFTIYVIRWSNEENIWKNSKPCESCTIFLKQIGIGKIIYTTGEKGKNFYKIERVKNLYTEHISSGMRMLNKKSSYKNKKN